MVIEEFKNIRQHKILAATILVIMIIPFLYSVFFLKSVWDPYGNTQYLPVAVVNNDKPVKHQGKTFKVGADLEKELRKNNNLGWHFVNEKEAQYGLSHKKYYTVITIPKDFSKNATTVLDKHPKKMKLTYNTNDSLNYIGKVISEEGAKRVNSSVRDTVSEAYATTMFNTIKKVGKGFTKAANGAEQLSNGAYVLSNGLKVYTAGVDKVNNGVIQLKSSVAPLSTGVLKLTTGANVLANGLNQLQDKTKILASGSNQLYMGSQTLNGGLSQYVNGTAKLALGIGELFNNTDTLFNGANQLANGSNKLNKGIQGYTAGVQTLKNGLSTLNDNSNNLKIGAKEIASYNRLLANKVGNIDVSQFKSTNIEKILEGLQQLQTLKAGLQPAMQALGNLQSNMSDVADDLNTAKTSASQLSASLESNLQKAGTDIQGSSADIQDVLDSANLSANEKQKLQDALHKNQTAGSAILNAGNSANQFKTQLDGLTKKLSGFQNQMKNLNEMSGQLTNAVTTLNSININPKDLQATTNKLQDLATGIAELQIVSNQLAKASEKLSSGVNDYTNGVSTALNGADKITSMNGQLNLGASQLSNGTAAMKMKLPLLITGITQLRDGSVALVANNNKILTGSAQLTTSLGQLNSQMPALTNGVSQLTSGGNQLATGLGHLNAKLPTLTSGINQLANGTQQLTTNSGQLIQGADKISKGNETLASNLKDGAKEVNGQNLNHKNANMFASPTVLKHKNYSYVPNYGYALAPYMLSVALYVGALVFNLVYPIRRLSSADGTATAWFWSKVSIGALVAVGNAVVEVGFMMLAGLHPDNPIMTFINAISFSLTAMFIIMLLAMILDNPGRFIGMILLVIQLGACGGSFPIQITKGMNGFFQAINPYLPMTYSVYGFRESLSSGLGSNQMVISLTVQLIFIVVSLLLLWISMSYLRTSGRVSYVEDPLEIKE